MASMADDWERGGPLRAICAGYERAPSGSVIQLRLLAGLFRIVLTGRAPELERFYPCLGGTSDPSGAWPAVKDVLASHVDELREALAIAPQTNEVGRANALLVGIFSAVARTGRSKVRLLEPGASAGLNLLVDRFRFVNNGWEFGPPSPVVLAGGVLGDVVPERFAIVERRGCDLSPVDVSTPEGRLRLRSFVWPFQVERHERLAAALQVASADPPVVDRASAGEWLTQHLSRSSPDDDVVTVVWQSVTGLYWPPEETARVDAAVHDAATRSALAHVCMEYPGHHGDDVSAELTVACSRGAADPVLHRVRLGSVGDHGFPVRLGE
jgi:hypothetical protein